MRIHGYVVELQRTEEAMEASKQTKQQEADEP